jgi:hypothetical protein
MMELAEHAVAAGGGAAACDAATGDGSDGTCSWQTGRVYCAFAGDWCCCITAALTSTECQSAPLALLKPVAGDKQQQRHHATAQCVVASAYHTGGDWWWHERLGKAAYQLGLMRDAAKQFDSAAQQQVRDPTTSLDISTMFPSAAD